MLARSASTGWEWVSLVTQRIYNTVTFGKSNINEYSTLIESYCCNRIFRQQNGSRVSALAVNQILVSGRLLDLSCEQCHSPLISKYKPRPRVKSLGFYQPLAILPSVLRRSSQAHHATMRQISTRYISASYMRSVAYMIPHRYYPIFLRC